MAVILQRCTSFQEKIRHKTRTPVNSSNATYASTWNLVESRARAPPFLRTFARFPRRSSRSWSNRSVHSWLTAYLYKVLLRRGYVNQSHFVISGTRCNFDDPAVRRAWIITIEASNAHLPRINADFSRGAACLTCILSSRRSAPFTAVRSR